MTSAGELQKRDIVLARLRKAAHALMERVPLQGVVARQGAAAVPVNRA